MNKNYKKFVSLLIFVFLFLFNIGRVWAIEKIPSSIYDLDNDYYYGDISDDIEVCENTWNLDEVYIDGVKFCGSSLANSYSWDNYYSRCQDPDYDTFELTFKSGSVNYTGFGCRKLKDENKREYEKKKILVGDNEVFEESKCFILAGNENSIRIDIDKDNCSIEAINDGVAKVRVVNKWSGQAKYIEYTIGIGNYKENEKPESNGNSEPEKLTRLDYSSICSIDNPGIRQAFKIVGYLLAIVRWLVPLIIIALGSVDFFKAMIANDDKEISKAGQKLIKRIVFGVAVFLIPTIIKAFIGFLEITNGIEKKEDTNFGACTKCIVDPFNDCETKKSNNYK